MKIQKTVFETSLIIVPDVFRDRRSNEPSVGGVVDIMRAR